MFKRILTLTVLYSITILALPNQPVNSQRKIAAGEGSTSCSACAQNSRVDALTESLDNLATVGRSTQSFPFKPVPRSVFSGTTVNMVSTATGQLAFLVTDLSVAGVLPLSFQRVYDSGGKTDHGLGPGWSFIFNDSISIIGDSALLTTGAGESIPFRAEGNRFVLTRAEPQPHQSFVRQSEDLLVEQIGDMTRSYRKLGPTYRLTNITDRQGNFISISFSDSGRINRISNNTGGQINLEWSAGRAPRLVKVWDHTGQAVFLRHAGDRLLAVADMDGAELRYSYTGDRLTGVFDASNRLALKVRYGPTGRVAEIGDAEGRTSFTYDSAPGSIVRATSITDPLGATLHYEHLGTGLLTLLRDATNSVTRIAYNDSNRPVSLTSPSGEETRFTYDAGDRLVRESSRQGETIYAYDLESRTSEANFNGQNRTFNARGQVVSQQSADGRRLTSEYDAAGNEIAFTLSDLGRFEIQRNAQGRVLSKRYPSGLLQQFDYDSRGRLTKQRDNRGRSINYKRDKSGALMSFATAEGNSVTAQRDEAGRITSLSTSSGKTRFFRYDKRGALTEFKDARGNRRVINYDRGGRVKSINEEGGDTIMVHRDAWGSVRGLVRINTENIGTGENNLSWPGEGKTLDAAAFQPINFKLSPTVSSVTTAPTQNLCAFGYGDGFTDGWGDDFGFDRDFGEGFVSSSCMDLFGIFGSRYTCGLDQGFAWFIDPWTEAGCSNFGGETYEQCAARQRQICERNRTACGAAAVSALAIAVGTCLITTHNNPTATAICMVAASAKYLADLTACDMHDQNCRLSIPDKCRR